MAYRQSPIPITARRIVPEMRFAKEKSYMPRADVAKDSFSHFDSIIDVLFSNASEEFLRSAISREEGLFLRELASQTDVRKTIEVGCANGVSTLYICAGLSSKHNVSHTAIDPFQDSEYQGRAVDSIRRTGFHFFQLIEQPSEIALPALLMKGERYDLALIDGLHTADQALVDFYYLDRMVQPGGIIVFDDVHSQAVTKIVHYVWTYPNYQLVGTCGRRGIRRRLLNTLKQITSMALWPVKQSFGEAIFREFVDIWLLQSETLWTIDSCTMIAFQKIADYSRDTNWYRGI